MNESNIFLRPTLKADTAKQNGGVYAKAMPYSAYGNCRTSRVTLTFNGTNAVLLNYQDYP
jgi:hypothetical protein